MCTRSNLLAVALLGGMATAPTIVTAQMMTAPLPPARPHLMVDPGAAPQASVATRILSERRQHAQPRAAREVPMPRPVPAIIAPTRP
jgi:hypothetical protein